MKKVSRRNEKTSNKKESKTKNIKAKFGEYKGHPIITLDLNGNGREFSFGLSKAKSILRHVKDIEKFIESNEE